MSGGTFTGNVASGGGAIQEAFATMTLSDSTFTSNSGTSFGGALDNGSSNATVTNCTFTTNSAPFSGAINNYNESSEGGSLDVSGSTFTDNAATNGHGGAIQNDLGGDGDWGDRVGQHVQREPGLDGRRAIYSLTHFGAGLGDTTTVSSSTFTSNTATGGSNGGALLNVGGTDIISDCTLSDNSADNEGGGIDSSEGTTTLTSCTVTGNSASFGGGMDNL